MIPFTLDQPFWGRRVKRLGVGPNPIPLKSLSTERLAAAIQIVATDESMRQRAAQLGEIIRGEDGIGNVIRIIEQAAPRPNQ